MNRKNLVLKVAAISLLVIFLPGRASGKGRAADPAPSQSQGQPVQAGTVNINLPEGMTKEQADAILTELRAIHQLLEKLQQQPQQLRPSAGLGPGPNSAPAADEKISLKIGPDWFATGREDAPVTLVEFVDYQCPYCRRFYQQTFPELKSKYIDTGRVRFVSRNFPLDIHPQAQLAAFAAHCAGDQSRFWEMRGALLSATDLSEEALLRYSDQLGLDNAAFRACLEGDGHKADLQAELALASALDISGTPTFVIGKTGREELQGQLVVGAQPLARFESVIDQLLGPQAPVAQPGQ